MTTKTPALVLLLSATVLLTAGSKALAEAPALSEAQINQTRATAADAHFARGKKLVRQGKQAAARTEYLAALEARKSFDAAGNLGSLEIALELFRDAAEHLSYAVQHYAPSSTTPQQLEKARGRLAEAKLHVAEVVVDVNAAGAEVLVDRISVGRAPLEERLFLEPGGHVIEAKLAGFEPATQWVVVEARSSWTVIFGLVAAAPP